MRRLKGAAKRKAMRNAPEAEPEFQIAPMIDILLVLLVFFMSISSTEALQSNKEIDLPVAREAKQPKENPGQVIINITWSEANNVGAIEIDNETFPTPQHIIRKLQDKLMATPQTRVLIRADRTVRYSYMKEVMRAVGQSGIPNITFSVVDKDVK